MDLKKFAVRGIVILAICVALCLFFSGTVRTLTTPKVKLTTARRGKLEERIELACRPAFPDAEEIAPSAGSEAPSSAETLESVFESADAAPVDTSPADAPAEESFEQ